MNQHKSMLISIVFKVQGHDLCKPPHEGLKNEYCVMIPKLKGPEVRRMPHFVA